MAYPKYDQLYPEVKAALSRERFEHVVRTGEYAVHLAELNHYDIEKARIGGLIHDYAKERTADDFLAEIDKKHLDPDLKNWNSAIWHGVVGAEFAKDELGIEDEELLNSMRRHTTADVNMTMLDKIVFMADFLELGRNFADTDVARDVTEQSLDDGVAWQLEFSVTRLVRNHRAVYPKTIYAYNHWVGGK
ncbi:bis(5'-nucleosyl)-tetraphosphatase (symmetrical) YqeK [Oenococcus kitaharae]|uniref:bis(5'-nucleosyl)-tetraphosphatase (symmetrical) YqeK n=1 Tax=Oenococcus TaxID=46254 RepID=UPI0021E85387|nr:bis(5'-nucleosyl)-tetraphosphatase (symmetrical) YqeK [Oenococcus kitaharae]MCV3295709.1 bis(5'-nucleosyl)-tetraphosphatase (symmetrical) YqeK [Oenococcus kitaharae]